MQCAQPCSAIFWPGRSAVGGEETTTDALVGAHVDIARQRRLSGLLAAVATAGRRLAVPCYCACLLHEPVGDAWELTALVGPDERPVDLRVHGIAIGAFPFIPPDTLAIAPLPEILAASWGADTCARLESLLAAPLAVCAPVPDEGQPRAALLALVATRDEPSPLATVVLHAATAARALLPPVPAAQPRTILGPAALALRAEHELARAKRYERPAALVAVDFGEVAEATDVGAVVLRGMRRYDLAGRVDSDRPLLAVLLPETDRRGAEGFIQRVTDGLPAVRAAAAVFPGDGASLSGLLLAAREQMRRT